jgi:hypothetical protein
MASGRKEAVLFLKKKNQKNFCPLARASHPARAQWTKVFCFFFPARRLRRRTIKKEDACFLA